MRIRRLSALLFSLVAATFLLMWAVSWRAVASDPGSAALGAPGTTTDARQTPAARGDKLDPALADQLAETHASEMIRVIVRLRAKAPAASQQPGASPLARRATVVGLLQETAATSQKNLIQQLEAMRQRGLVETYRSFWIFNGLAVTLSPQAIDAVAGMAEVKILSLDTAQRYFDPPPDSLNLEVRQTASSAATGAPSWGVQRIGAPLAWEALGIRGDGVTVAIVDSGVDWRHPDLAPNYRGNLGGGAVQHVGNWYHTVTPTMTEPVDLLGHGTHVAGTAVGLNGIGVAPGARWIAVAIADEFGFIYNSSVHAGFQWLLAPEGDPALAPDIVNNSWGGSPYATEFVEDVEALQAAGIITLFAAGNDGPETSSINSPASYTGTLAVGASDDLDSVAWFSSRGPSPLTAELKPWLVAPGTRVLSTLPGEAYGLSNGTSMATPHVAGTIALLLSADPALSLPSVRQLLAGTAEPIAAHHPNDDSGWGRLDAYRAVSQLGDPGMLQGAIWDGQTPMGQTMVTVTTPGGAQLPFQTDTQGRYKATLQPGLYSVAAAPFGYELSAISDLRINAGEVTLGDIRLVRRPWGSIRGLVRQGGTNLPLRATVTVSGTPAVTASDGSGRYALQLPAGRYELIYTALGHRLGSADLDVSAGGDTVSDAYLVQAPRVLLVDSGQWYYDSHIGFYEDALAQVGYAHDWWQIQNPFDDVPALEDFRPYDVVVWSAPQDSPGYLAANDVITDYLGLGGNLLISGQNVAALDGGAFFPQIWWYRQLEGEFTGKAGSGQRITGDSAGYFKGITLTLNGGSSAGNQVAIDESRPAYRSLTRPAFADENGRPVGLTAGHCDPFRIAYLGFGLEGISDREDRATVLRRSFDYFQSPRQESGVAWMSDPVDDFALAGQRLTYTLTVRNLSETITDTMELDISDNIWGASLVTRTLTLGSCQTGETVLTIDVPAGVPDDTIHTLEVTAQSGNNLRARAALQLRHKTPGQWLLVDDDRWYDQETVFQSALGGLGLVHDTWEIGWDENVRGSPPAELLNAYDFVIWYTGYDWFAPITPRENHALVQYLAQGGRLFLTSQDFMYYHHDTPLARTYLGVVEHHESITPTAVYGGDNPVLPSSLAGPLLLHYGKYQNFSDGLVYGPGSQPFIWHDKGMAAGVATAGPGWRSIFWGIPFETLPSPIQGDAMGAIVAWLSDLGDSSLTVDKRSVSPGEAVVYTMTVRNLTYAPQNHVWLSNTLPAELTILPSSLTGGAIYSSADNRVFWEGMLGPGQSHVVSYLATAAKGLKGGTLLENRVSIGYERHGIDGHGLEFNRVAASWIHAPDLSGSTLSAEASGPGPRQTVTYTLHLRNDGVAPARPASATVTLPDGLDPLTGTLRYSGGNGFLSEQQIHWQGTLPPGKDVWISIVMTREISLHPLWLPAMALVDDGASRTLLRQVQPYLPPYQKFFPLFFRDAAP